MQKLARMSQDERQELLDRMPGEHPYVPRRLLDRLSVTLWAEWGAPRELVKAAREFRPWWR